MDSQSSIPNLQIANLCQNSQIGKKLPTALYVHISALNALDPQLKLYESYASSKIDCRDKTTLIKFHTNKPKISYLFYPDFDIDPHPALQNSIQVNVETGEINHKDYSNIDNPPILHRKETFVTPDYPHYQKFAELTKSEEALGLLDRTRTIGTRQGWLELLERQGVEIQLDHSVVEFDRGEDEENYQFPIPKIERHKAAMSRNSLSKPVRLALEANLFTEGLTFFDYGCGYGGDVKRLAEKNITTVGWDPYYQPDTSHVSADIVNLGYVINVIEDPGERREALVNSWELTKKVLIVAAQVLIDDRNKGRIAYGDGVITSRNTFQKYYEQEELKVYIDRVLNVDSIPVALGIYFVFRDEAEGQNFRASRFRSRVSTPRIRVQVKRFEDYEEVLAPLMAFMTDRGRLPVKGELPEESIIKDEFRTFNRAFQVILQATDGQEWEAIADKRRQDLLVYIALSNLGDSPQFRKFPTQIKNDIKGLFDNYQKACVLADLMLYSLGSSTIISDICQDSAIGYKVSKSLSVHISALEELDPLLRLYEGCANRTIGRLDGATVIKFHTNTPKISYLFYPDFDTDPHPALDTAMHIDLRDLSVSYEEYFSSRNPPILHRKETFVTPNYPLYDKFAQLSRQEEYLGILDNISAIKNRRDWVNFLREYGVKIKDHCVFWRSDADPERVKILKEVIRDRVRKSKTVNS
ncbi:DNA phosphorothioation-associated putative methyltransferase [Kamptonema sp. UHCC 0994]|uniref:DNA phosphorothioation-associated putative methyltransferase n=1 Tax=Kamptonema sp. UHCC 0994 TaxID=3031329 RepID=UPI0023BAA10F|nr:DNA phosphorothioation-associated putative methyltransferase [Kamptonema sp. UHCC 0994]MDF0556718.1 DNA phosphorothioation-associated putative methyltransferase [Kamptonema sp. UHCC 0994]